MCGIDSGKVQVCWTYSGMVQVLRYDTDVLRYVVHIQRRYRRVV